MSRPMFSLGLRGLTSAAKGLQAYRSGAEGAFDEGVKAGATALRNAARAELRKPGTGRVYPSRVGRTVRKQQSAIAKTDARITVAGNEDSRYLSRQRAALKRSQSRHRKTLKRLAAEGVNRLQSQNVLRPGQQRVPLHQASVEGAAPAPDVGLLPQAVKAGVLDGTRVVGVGGSWKGWVALHEGRGRVKGPRPFLSLALARVADKLGGIMVSRIKTKLPRHG